MSHGALKHSYSGKKRRENPSGIFWTVLWAAEFDFRTARCPFHPQEYWSGSGEYWTGGLFVSYDY